MTLYSTLIIRVRAHAQDEDSGSYRYSDAYLLQVLAEGAQDFHRRVRDIKASVSGTIATANEGVVTFSSDLSVSDIMLVHKVYCDGRIIEPVTISQLEEKYPNWTSNAWEDASGDPLFYTMETTGFTGLRLVPKPQDDVVLKVWYIKGAAAVSSSATTVDVGYAWENALVFYAASEAFAREIDSPGGSNYLSYSKRFREKYEEMVTDAANHVSQGFNFNQTFTIPTQQY